MNQFQGHFSVNSWVGFDPPMSTGMKIWTTNIGKPGFRGYIANWNIQQLQYLSRYIHIHIYIYIHIIYLSLVSPFTVVQMSWKIALGPSKWDQQGKRGGGGNPAMFDSREMIKMAGKWHGFLKHPDVFANFISVWMVNRASENGSEFHIDKNTFRIQEKYRWIPLIHEF